MFTFIDFVGALPTFEHLLNVKTGVVAGVAGQPVVYQGDQVPESCNRWGKFTYKKYPEILHDQHMILHDQHMIFHDQHMILYDPS